MPRIEVVITARASLARVYTVLEALHGKCDLRIILAGGALLHHYGDTERDIPWPIAHRVYSALAGNTLSTTAAETGLLTSYLAHIFREDAPDLVVTIADRHETLATATAASYQNIPLAHIQGGEHTGSIDDKVRYAITALADYHFPATAQAARTLYARGAQRIWLVGCPSIDLCTRAQYLPQWSRTLVVLQHPVTTEAADAAAQIDETFAAITSDEFALRPVVWLWPGQDAGSDALAKRIREHRENDPISDRLSFLRHLPAQQFLSVLRSAAALIGNSSAGIREGAFLGCPVVNIGTRQQHRERAGNVLDVGYNRDAIRHAIRQQLDHGRYQSSTLYGEGWAGTQIATYLLALCGHPAPQDEPRVPAEVAAAV